MAAKNKKSEDQRLMEYQERANDFLPCQRREQRRWGTADTRRPGFVVMEGDDLGSYQKRGSDT